MEKQSLLINNIKYAAYKDNDNFFYPVSPIEEFLVIRVDLPVNTQKNISFSSFEHPVRLEDLFFYSSNVTSNKTINIKLKDSSGAIIWGQSIPINNSSIIVLPKIVILPSFTFEIIASATVESLSLQLKQVELVT